MMLYHIDSFTRTPFRGNPAGVVLDADGLSEAQMQDIARELKHSETAFVLRPSSADHDVWVRFFTPAVEVPVCGHATIAAHYALAHARGRYVFSVDCAGRFAVTRALVLAIANSARPGFLYCPTHAGLDPGNDVSCNG